MKPMPTLIAGRGEDSGKEGDARMESEECRHVNATQGGLGPMPTEEARAI